MRYIKTTLAATCALLCAWLCGVAPWWTVPLPFIAAFAATVVETLCVAVVLLAFSMRRKIFGCEK